MDSKEQNRQALATTPVPRLLAKLAIPTVVAQLINLLYNIVDRIYIGHIPEVGSDALTGVGLFMPILMLINAFAMLAGAGGAPRAAIAMGQGRKDTAEKILGNCLTLMLMFAAVLTIVFYAASPTLLRLFGASDNTLPYALAYTRIYVLGSVCVILVMGLNPFITTQGFATFSMLTTVIGAVMNIILDPVLIFVLHMGVSGAAIATVFSQCVSALWVLRFLTGKKTILRIHPSNMPLEAKIFMPCLGLGISTFVMLSTESLLSICFNSSLARYGGDIAVGAMTILTSTYQLLLLPMQGVCQGAQPIISFNFGAGNRKRVKDAFRLMFTICMGYATLYCTLTLLLPQVFAGIFTNSQPLVEYTAWAMRIYMAGSFATGCQIACQQSFMALGQAKLSLLMACLRKLVLLIPLILILPHMLSNQVMAVFLAEPVSDIVAGVITGIVFFSQLGHILERGAGK